MERQGAAGSIFRSGGRVRTRAPPGRSRGLVAMTPLEAAIASGLPCIPCRGDNKAPTIPGPGGHKHAAADPAELRAFWRRYPGPLVGVRTGEASGLSVLDIVGRDIPRPMSGWQRIARGCRRPVFIARGRAGCTSCFDTHLACETARDTIAAWGSIRAARAAMRSGGRRPATWWCATRRQRRGRDGCCGCCGRWRRPQPPRPDRRRSISAVSRGCFAD